MKTLINLSLLFSMILLAFNASGQTFGIRAGFNLADMTAKEDGERYDDDWKMKPAFHFGGIVHFPVNEFFAAETGLLFTSKGTRVSEDGSDGDDSWKYKVCVNMYYIEIPITGQFRYELDDITPFITFGPYIGFGITGNVKETYTENNDKEKDKWYIHWGNDEDNDDFKRFDAGLIFGAGAEYGSFQFGLNYNLGLANISAYSSDSYKIKHRVLNIYVVYFIGKKDH